MIDKQEQLFIPETYFLREGSKIDFDPSRVLLPDKVSEVIGIEAAQALDAVRFLAKDKSKPLRILELGVGTGVSLVSTLVSMRNGGDIFVEGIDIDPYCVENANKNLDAITERYGFHVEKNIRQGDWFDQEVWDSFEPNAYHAIIFNPPYLPKGEDPGVAYKDVPPSAMFTDDAEGVQHYDHVMPKLASLISADEGSTLLIRRSSRLEFMSEKFSKLIDALMSGIGVSNVCTNILYPIESDRLAHILSISVTPKALAPHKDPLVIIAQERGLNAPLVLNE